MIKDNAEKDIRKQQLQEIRIKNKKSKLKKKTKLVLTRKQKKTSKSSRIDKVEFRTQELEQ